MTFTSVLKTLLIVGTSLLTFSVSAQHKKNCQHQEHEQQRIKNDPTYLHKRALIEENTQTFIKRYRNSRIQQDTIYTIPIVVHIIYESSESENNLSDAQIKSQIDVLNEDFSKTNSNFSKTPLVFQSLGADVGIRFKLADTDPSGNPTTGITRTITTVDEIGETEKYYKTSEGGITAWDVTQYLNIWVCELAPGLLGFAYFPSGSAVDYDGAVISPNYFGRVTGTSNLGRTATHEIGHYLNLDHIWGGGGCSSDDKVDDTPIQDSENYGCPTHPSASCSSNDLFNNYMDYVNDDCMTLFTHGQKERMLAALKGPRKGLLTSKGVTTATIASNIEDNNNITIYPNPTQGSFIIASTISTTAHITLHTILGDIVQEQDIITENSIDVSTLSNGTYILKIEQNNVIYTKRLTINQ